MNSSRARSGVSARSVDRSSVSWPSRRSRCSDSPGSNRLAMTRRSPCCELRRNRSRLSVTCCECSCSKSSSTTISGSESWLNAPATAATKSMWIPSDGSGRGGERSPEASRTSLRSSLQKRAGRPSGGSSDSQTTGPRGGRAASHVLSSSVLPAPGGPVISVNSPCVPRSSRSKSSGLCTAALGRGGAYLNATAEVKSLPSLRADRSGVGCPAERASPTEGTFVFC